LGWGEGWGYPFCRFGRGRDYGCEWVEPLGGVRRLVRVRAGVRVRVRV